MIKKTMSKNTSMEWGDYPVATQILATLKTFSSLT